MRDTPLVPSFNVNQKDGEPGLAEFCFILDDCLQDFSDICLVACGKDV